MFRPIHFESDAMRRWYVVHGPFDGSESHARFTSGARMGVAMRNSTRRHRYRRIALWSLTSIAIIQLGLSALIETRLMGVRDPEYAFREARWRDRLGDHPNQTRIVFLGSSRVACGVDAERITRTFNGDAVAFNFGIPKAGPFSQRVYLERLNDSGLLPDVVLIEVMIPLLCGKDAPFEERSLDGERFAISELADLSIDKNIRGAYRKWLFHRAFPVQGHGAELRQRCGLDQITPVDSLERENADLDRYGWRASGLPPERLADVKALAHRQYDEGYRSFAVHPEQRRRLDGLIARCLELGSTPILILMPEGSEFRQLLPPNGELRLQELLRDMQARHGVRSIDARTWMNDDAFIDMHHLDGQAAMVFSERLAREALSPSLQYLAIAERRR